MADKVYWVQLQSGSGEKAVAFSFPFESTHPDVATLTADLVGTGVVCGSKLKLGDDGHGGRIIERRTGIAFGLSGFVSAQDYLGRLVGERR